MTITATDTRHATKPAAQNDRWRSRSACRDVDPDLFFPEGSSDAAIAQEEEAKAICRGCPVMQECLDWSLAHRQDSGVAGGLSEAERRSLHRRRAADPDGDALNAADHILKYRLTEFLTLKSQGLSNGKIAAALGTNGLTVMKVAEKTADLSLAGSVTDEDVERVLSQARKMRAPAQTSARQLSVQHGAYLLRCLVEDAMSVKQVALQLGASPLSVYTAFLILVPRAEGRPRAKRPSVIEMLLETSKEKLATMERIGRTHVEIADELHTSQSIVSAALSVLKQRNEALHRLEDAGVADPLKRLQDEELRVRLEVGVGLSVDDVIQSAGEKILRMHAARKTLRQIAGELHLCRETVRLAYQQMVEKGMDNCLIEGVFESKLEQNDMEEVA